MLIERQSTAELMDWALRHPVRGWRRDAVGERQPEHWWGMDGSLAFNIGVAPAAPTVATLMRQYSQWLSDDPENIPAGAVVFWRVSNEVGHTSITLTDGGDAQLFADVAGLRVLTFEEAQNRHAFLGWIDFAGRGLERA